MAVVEKSVALFNRRRVLTAALLLLWLAIITAAAGPAAGQTWIGGIEFGWLSYLMLALMGLGVLTILAGLIAVPSSSQPLPPRRRGRVWTLIIIGLVILLLGRRQPGPEDRTVDPPPPPAVSAAAGTGNNAGGADIGGRELVAVVAIVAAAAAVVLWSRRADQADNLDEATPTLTDALAPALARATEQLLDEADPRSAVLLAYRGLEQALERRGLPRSAAETPTEHLQRVLQNQPLDPGPLVELSTLYELARFSQRSITAADQQRAARSLSALLDELTTPDGPSRSQGVQA